MVRVHFGGEWVRIDKVLYVPGLQGNLLSIGQLAERDIECRFSSQGAELRRNDEVLAVAQKIGRNYVLGATQEARIATASNTTADNDADSYRLWHKRMAHAGQKKMMLLYKAADGVPTLD